MTSNIINISIKLNMDVIQHILSYNDDLRILKIKMNKQNIKYLFENSKELYTYLWCMKEYLNFSNIEESIYVDMIKHLSDKNYTMKEVKKDILSSPSHNDCLSNSNNNNSFEYLIDIIINNYNTYYLDDEYYYNGYWYKDYWHFGEGKKFYDGYPRIMKTKMNEQNMKSLIKNNREIYNYLRCMEQHSSFPPNIEEKMYLDMVFLMTDENYTMEKIRNHILSFPPYNKHLTTPDYDYRFNVRNENWLKYFIYIIINNYNNYYLNDTYYDNGYWYDNRWVHMDYKKFYDGYPYGFS